MSCAPHTLWQPIVPEVGALVPTDATARVAMMHRPSLPSPSSAGVGSGVPRAARSHSFREGNLFPLAKHISLA